MSDEVELKDFEVFEQKPSFEEPKKKEKKVFHWKRVSGIHTNEKRERFFKVIIIETNEFYAFPEVLFEFSRENSFEIEEKKLKEFRRL